MYRTVCPPFGHPDHQPTDILQWEASFGLPGEAYGLHSPSTNMQCTSTLSFALLHKQGCAGVETQCPKHSCFACPNVTFPFCACTQPNKACSRLLTWSSQPQDRKASLSEGESSDSLEQKGLLGFLPQLVEQVVCLLAIFSNQALKKAPQSLTLHSSWQAGWINMDLGEDGAQEMVSSWVPKYLNRSCHKSHPASSGWEKGKAEANWMPQVTGDNPRSCPKQGSQTLDQN